jgi:hypothetical protein
MNGWFGVNTLILIAVLAVGSVPSIAMQSDKPVDGQPALLVPLGANLPSMNLTIVALNGTQLRLNSANIGNLPSHSGYGGFINILGNIKMWGYYTGVSLTVLCNLVGGITANDNLTVIASDNYTIRFTYAQVNGSFVTYNNVTGKQVPHYQPLTPILAYWYDGANLTSDEGGPLRLVIVGPEGLCTNSTLWVKWVVNMEIVRNDVPEFPSLLIFPLLLVVTLVAAFVLKTRRQD